MDMDQILKIELLHVYGLLLGCLCKCHISLIIDLLMKIIYFLSSIDLILYRLLLFKSKNYNEVKMTMMEVSNLML